MATDTELEMDGAVIGDSDCSGSQSEISEHDSSFE